MAAVSEDPITLWLKLGALEKLEQVVLDGYGDQLYGKTSRIPQVNKFLRQVPLFQNKIDEIHKAVSTGNLRDVQHLIDRKKLAFCRDHMGASPMHKAVLFSQKPIIDYLLDRYPSVVHARDHRGRTPLHYAAVLSDSGEIYKMLLDHGADVKATDVYGNRPEYYMHAQDEIDIQALREGNETKAQKPVKIKHFVANANESPQKESTVAKSAKPAGPRSQIRELINSGNVENLEELVLQGHGDRLLGETTGNVLVRDFIRMVPIYMERIHEIHRAVTRDRLRDVQTLLDRKKLALARDPLGATPLHKAIMYGHKDIAQYIATNFPLTKDTKDLDGRTPLHYAAALKDNHEMYNMLIAMGANPLILDYRGKTAEYYLQFPEHMHLEQMIKQSQRINANYMANHANRMKANSPKRKSPYPPRAALGTLDGASNHKEKNGDLSDVDEDSQPLKNGHVTFKLPKKTLFKSQPLLPLPKLKRLEINSANIKRWVREEDLEKLEGAVLEGYGEKVASQRSDNAKLQKYIQDQVPMLVKKIEAIHIAVSNDDITELQSQLLDTDHMVLAKDRFGMAPIHRAVLMNKPETLAFLIDRFPETVNARDKEGRTALHYAAAMSREPGASNYFKMLLEAGADARIRDNQGRSAEYYRTHHVPIPHKLDQQFKFSKKLRSKSEPPPQNRVKKLPGINGAAGNLTQSTVDKIHQWLQNGDLDHLKELVHEGYGQHLVGKTSWNEDVKKYLKHLPLYLMSLGSAFHAVERGDVLSLDKQILSDESLLRAKNAEGSTLIHHAVQHDNIDVLNYFFTNHPNLMNLKDRNGRTPLHIAGQQKNQYIYSILSSAGADPMILDLKGRSAEFYMSSAGKQNIKQQISPQSSTPDNESTGDKSNSTPEQVEEQNTGESEPEEKAENTPEGDHPEGDREEPAEEENKQEEETEKNETGATPPPEEPNNGSTAEAETEAEAEAPKPNEDSKEDSSDENKENIEENKMPKDSNTEEEILKMEEQRLKVAFENEENRRSASSRASEAVVSSSGDRLNELIDVWIRERDLLRLEHVVIAGQGDRLIGRTSDDRQVQEFLDLVPTYMARIRGVHDAVVRGNLGEVESVLTRKRFALSRDQLGASPLHLAVLHGHTDVVKYIIDNFPEALDGPDNEGRTPLHYAAVMRDGGNYYRILLMAGADETVVDKTNHTPDYYLTHPGALTIRDLLEGYRIRELNRRPSQVNIWQRPPTDENNKRDPFDEDEEYDPFIDPEPGNTPAFSDSTSNTEATNQDDQQVQVQPQTTSIYPILFDRQNRDSRYLASVLGDALIKGLTQVAQRRPRDPIGYLATYLYQYAAMKSGAITASREDEVADFPEETEGNSSPVKAERLPEKEDGRENNEQRQEKEPANNPLDSVDEDANEFEDDDDFSLEFEDHTKMKDEEGQTVLHFAAARVHPDGSFYGLLSHAEVLLGERDVLYRTCRDVAEETGQSENMATIDRYLFDAFLQQRTSLIHMLLHEGYDHLIHINDNTGRDLATVLQQQRLSSSLTLLREVADFVKRREELHGYVRNNYLEGVSRLVKSDNTLVTAKGPRARCALHVAVLFQNLNVINALVKANSSSVHVGDNLGRTPLHYAMAMEKVDKIAKVLVKAGALRSTKDVKMRTPSYFFIYKDEIYRLYEEELRLA